MLYWKRLLREAGVDWTRIGSITKDRAGWKKIVRERMDHVKKWEWSQGHSWVGEPLLRATREAVELVHKCEVCEKVCKTKAGLTIHRRRIHEVSPLKKTFTCTKCKEEFQQEANLKKS